MEEVVPVGAGKCGMGSIGHWKWDFSQHHWLEVSVRTDGRPYELVLQVTQELVQRSYIYRAPIPQMKRKLSPLAAGPYAVLGVAHDPHPWRGRHSLLYRFYNNATNATGHTWHRRSFICPRCSPSLHPSQLPVPNLCIFPHLPQ